MLKLNLIDIRGYLIHILLFNFIISILIGQNLQNLGLDNKDKVLRLPETFIIESEIDPQMYTLGPGDKIGLSVITSANMAYVMTITPTGDLWIPDMGIVHISGMDIKSAEIQVAQYIKENRFKSADITLVLLNIRNFKIQVIGAVIMPGFINVSSVQRLTDVIRKSGGLHKLADEEKITILRISKDMLECSLRSYQMNGNLLNNPVLKEGDIIHVPYRDDYIENVQASISHNQSFVYVTGFVLKPTGHKFIPGFSVKDYIAMSGGVTDFGSMKKISIYRNDKLIPMNEKIIIKPGDYIDVPSNMKYRMLGNMSILQTITAIMTLYLTFLAAI